MHQLRFNESARFAELKHQHGDETGRLAEGDLLHGEVAEQRARHDAELVLHAAALAELQRLQEVAAIWWCSWHG